jgi:hypothetical protein
MYVWLCAHALILMYIVSKDVDLILVRVRVRFSHTHTHTHTHACIHDACTHAVLHTCIHTCIRTYIHTYIHTCIHTYIRTCIRAYVHLCIRAYMQELRKTRCIAPQKIQFVYTYTHVTRTDKAERSLRCFRRRGSCSCRTRWRAAERAGRSGRP